MDLSVHAQTERTRNLKKALYDRGFSNRSSEWIKQGDLNDIAEKHGHEPVIIRRAYAIKEMLEKLASEKVSSYAHTYEIADEELIVGVLPMASNGLGKVFPNYLTPEEKRAATVTNKTELALLGHNTVNYEKLLKGGIKAILEDCKIKKANIDQDLPSEIKEYKKSFYEAVEISLKAVVAYAEQYANLAKKKAQVEKDLQRKEELLKIEKICRKVPMNKPDTFYEALQSIYFYHVALHSSCELLSLGRLDQVLDKYLPDTVTEGKKDFGKAIELFECFLIKAAGRLNLTTEYLFEQDHMDFNAALGTHPYYLDQRAGTNNFLQNVILGGKKPDGTDATNECTYTLLQAFENVNLSTPGVYVRLGSSNPDEPEKDELKKAVARTLDRTKNIPAILNDDVLVPAMLRAFIENEVYSEDEIDIVAKSVVTADMDLFSKHKQKIPPHKVLEYLKLANDYCVDGCWEPILNGESDWTFGMINGMTILECALNQGATLDSNPNMLRGGKLCRSYGEIKSKDDLDKCLKKTIEFFVDQSAMSMYQCYLMDEFINPSPLFSALLGTCMERGRDRSWGGTKYNIGGTILIGVPNMVNTICGIYKCVFGEGKKYTLSQVVEAMRGGFTEEDKKQHPLHAEIEKDLNNGPKFGNNDTESNEVAKMILDCFYEAVKNTKALADKIFLIEPKPSEREKIKQLRKLTGYYGVALQKLFGHDFNIRFTVGCGTFEQYPLQGSGIAGSADRKRGEPLAPNFSPVPGTVKNGVGNVLASYKDYGLARFAAGVMTDLALGEDHDHEDVICELINDFIENKGSMLTLAINKKEVYQTMYDLSCQADKGDEEARKKLKNHADVNVRVGGWQAPFITMSLKQQENYLKRSI